MLSEYKIVMPNTEGAEDALNAAVIKIIKAHSAEGHKFYEKGKPVQQEAESESKPATLTRGPNKAKADLLSDAELPEPKGMES